MGSRKLIIVSIPIALSSINFITFQNSIELICTSVKYEFITYDKVYNLKVDCTSTLKDFTSAKLTMDCTLI